MYKSLDVLNSGWGVVPNSVVYKYSDPLCFVQPSAGGQAGRRGISLAPLGAPRRCDIFWGVICEQPLFPQTQVRTPSPVARFFQPPTRDRASSSANSTFRQNHKPRRQKEIARKWLTTTKALLPKKGRGGRKAEEEMPLSK